MTLLMFGTSSFIGQAAFTAAQARHVPVISRHHADESLSPPNGHVTLVNFSFDPSLRNSPYSSEADCDARLAEQARRLQAGMVVLSSRCVYTPPRFGAIECSEANGDETDYGRNKATIEKAVLDILPHRATILRLSNIFGFEYAPTAPRRTFFGIMLNSLKSKGVIRFDMHPDTRRDFLPVEICANAILDAALSDAGGIYNVGCGFPVRCGDVAEWLMQGFGGGKLVIEAANVRDEFYLDTTKWQDRFGPLVSERDLREYCIDLGRKLRDA